MCAEILKCVKRLACLKNAIKSTSKFYCKGVEYFNLLDE